MANETITVTLEETDGGLLSTMTFRCGDAPHLHDHFRFGANEFRVNKRRWDLGASNSLALVLEIQKVV